VFVPNEPIDLSEAAEVLLDIRNLQN
jgi:hypothetical protein